MIRIHDRQHRGVSKTGWLDSKHTFSFGGFNDPTRMGVSALRVINDDLVIPGAGFPTHGHRDMEILTYVLSGALAHKDSLGNGGVILPGDIQLMTAGAGITHSEMNASKEDPVHFLQIWIEPNESGLPAGYQQISLPEDIGQGGFTPIVAPTAGKNRLRIHQDAEVSVANPRDGEKLTLQLAPGRRGFLHVVDGALTINGEPVKSGDGVEFDSNDRLDLNTQTDSSLLLFDLP